MTRFFSFVALVTMFFFTGDVLAEAANHVAPWKLGMPEAAAPVKEMMHHFHNELLIITTAITIFVTMLLAYVVVRFNRKANPKPSKTTHNVLIEVIWTAVPVIILIVIAVPSFRLVYFQDVTPDQTVERAIVAAGGEAEVYDEMTLKVIGYQWYWGYEYPDHGNFYFDSYMLTDDQLTEERPYRLLEVDNRVVVPVDTIVRVQMTAADVIHAWAIPAFGVKMDAVPGRLNETWFRATKEGVYYGQCSELCGVRHGFMPIVVEVVSKEEFKQWVKGAKREFGHVDLPQPYQIALN